MVIVIVEWRRQWLLSSHFYIERLNYGSRLFQLKNPEKVSETITFTRKSLSPSRLHCHWSKFNSWWQQLLRILSHEENPHWHCKVGCNLTTPIVHSTDSIYFIPYIKFTSYFTKSTDTARCSYYDLHCEFRWLDALYCTFFTLYPPRCSRTVAILSHDDIGWLIQLQFATSTLIDIEQSTHTIRQGSRMRLGVAAKVGRIWKWSKAFFKHWARL